MSLKTVVITTTFDPAVATMEQQANVICPAIKQILEAKTGLTLESKKLGKLVIKGNRPVAVRCQIKVVAVSPKDNDQDRKNGSAVGVEVLSPTFDNAIINEMISLFGESAVLSVATSLDNALAQTPPGLIVEAGPAPKDLIFKDILDPEGQYMTQICLDPAGADLGIGEAADITWTGDLVAAPSDDLFYSCILAPFGPTSPLTLTKNTKVEGTITIDAVVWAVSVDQSGDTLVVTKDGSPVGVVKSESFVGTDRSVAGFFTTFSETGLGIQCGIQELDLSTPSPMPPELGNVRQQYFEVGTYALDTPSITGKITLTNNTGAIIPAGTVVNDVQFFGSAIVTP